MNSEYSFAIVGNRSMDSSVDYIVPSPPSGLEREGDEKELEELHVDDVAQKIEQVSSIVHFPPSFLSYNDIFAKYLLVFGWFQV